MKKQFIEQLKAEVVNYRHSPLPGDGPLSIKFYIKQKINKAKSKDNERPIYTDKLYISVRAPGEKDPIFDGEAKDTHIERFLPIYERFLNNQENLANGTDLKFLPTISEEQEELCKSLSIYTLEQLAEVKDVAIAKLGMGGRALVSDAKKYIKGTSEVGALRKQLETMQNKINDLEKQNEALKGKPKPKVVKMEAKDESTNSSAKRSG